jgi:hydroxymethylbilane synthase
MKIRIGTRGSDLALWQAHHVRDILQNEGHEIEIKIIKTKGDKIQNLSFDKIEGKGFFTKEIEDHLLRKEIDLAIHSLKDLETDQPQGLELGAYSKREVANDILICLPKVWNADKPKAGAIIGTSAARRQAFIKHLFPEIEVKDLRGNVPTRIQKLRDGNYDAIILAKAGVERLELDLSDLEVIDLPEDKFVPAPAQGVLGLQIRKGDVQTSSALTCLHSEEVANCAGLERKILNHLDGGCHLPFGAYCTYNNGLYKLNMAYAPKAGSEVKHFFIENGNTKELFQAALKCLKD